MVPSRIAGHILSIRIVLILRHEVLEEYKEDKAVKYVEYTHFMQKNSLHYLEESVSDFEPLALKKVKEIIDLTMDKDTASALKNRLDALEDGLNKTLESYEEKERLQRIIMCMEKEKEILNEKISLQVAIENVKDRMSCISVGSFPWLVTPYCKITSRMCRPLASLGKCTAWLVC